jgi:TrmH family RNA methyltransferase
MLSSSNIKLINSLGFKKYREKHGLFIIEGDRLIRELLESGMTVIKLFALSDWLAETDAGLLSNAKEIITVEEKDLHKVSHLSTARAALALVRTEHHLADINYLSRKLSIALDNIQDPGNLGTIMRIAAWFGIENIICSKGSTDVYNPKTVQASMGALLHVKVSYADLVTVLSGMSEKGIPVYGATLDGEPVYDTVKSQEGMLLFGNESRGISGELLPFISHKISIPPSGKAGPGIDSLNVAMSAAIICNEFRRREA